MTVSDLYRNGMILYTLLKTYGEYSNDVCTKLCIENHADNCFMMQESADHVFFF